MKTIQKKVYNEPCMTVLRTAPMQMLAGSDPQVQKTSAKASTEHEALVKGENDYNVWDDDWSK